MAAALAARRTTSPPKALLPPDAPGAPPDPAAVGVGGGSCGRGPARSRHLSLAASALAAVVALKPPRHAQYSALRPFVSARTSAPASRSAIASSSAPLLHAKRSRTPCFDGATVSATRLLLGDATSREYGEPIGACAAAATAAGAAAASSCAARSVQLSAAGECGVGGAASAKSRPSAADCFGVIVMLPWRLMCTSGTSAASARGLAASPIRTLGEMGGGESDRRARGGGASSTTSPRSIVAPEGAISTLPWRLT